VSRVSLAGVAASDQARLRTPVGINNAVIFAGTLTWLVRLLSRRIHVGRRAVHVL
jgi:hypothetical protein